MVLGLRAKPYALYIRCQDPSSHVGVTATGGDQLGGCRHNLGLRVYLRDLGIVTLFRC